MQEHALFFVGVVNRLKNITLELATSHSDTGIKNIVNAIKRHKDTPNSVVFFGIIKGEGPFRRIESWPAASILLNRENVKATEGKNIPAYIKSRSRTLGGVREHID